MIPAWGILCLVVAALAGRPAKRQLHAQALSSVFNWIEADDPNAPVSKDIDGSNTPVPRTFTIDSVPNVEFQRAIVAVELTLGNNVDLRSVIIQLGFPSLDNTPAASRLQTLYDLSLLTQAVIDTCNNDDERINLIFDPLAPIAVTDCVQYDASGATAIRVRPSGANALSFPGAAGLGQQPDSASLVDFDRSDADPVLGGWRLLVTNNENTNAATDRVSLVTWSIQFEVYCYSRVSNAVGSLGSGIGFTDAQTVQCQSGYVATSTSMTCSITGPSANACILGGAGGALITWGLNNDIEGLNIVNTCPDISDATCIRTTDQLGRSIPVNRFLLYDRLMRYAWLPNGLIVTQVALSDLCTLALDREGRVFMWGRMFPETAVVYGTATAGSNIAQQIPGNDRRVAYQLPFPADTVITQIYAGEYSVYAALAAGGGVWMWGYNTAGNLGLPLTTEYTLSPMNVAVPTGARVVQIALFWAVSALVTNTGEVWMWGTNEYFNNGTTYNLAALIDANGGNTAGNDPDGNGNAAAGNVGIRTPNLIQRVMSPTPKRVGGNVLPASVVEVALMEYQTVARTKDGTLWYWGVQANTYYFQRRDRSLFPNAGTGVNLIDGAAAGGERDQRGLNPLVFDASKVAPINDALNGDFINIRVRDTTRFYKALSAYGGSIAALTTTSEIYTWGINVYIFWGMYGFANRDQLWTAAAQHGPFLSQVGVLGRALPIDNTVTAATPSLAFWLDEEPGRIATTNRQFIQLAQGGSFGLGLDTTGRVWQWGNQFVDNWFAENPATPSGVSAQGASGAFNNVEKTLPVGDSITILAAGAFHAAALDLRYLEQGCPITKPLMTSQDINFIRGLTNAQRGKFVASTTVTTVCRYDNPNWINHFVNVRNLKQVGTLPLAAVMPPNSNGVTIAFTSLGHGYYAVITTFTPTGTSMAALGITAVESRQIKFIVAIEQMFPDATMFITNPITMQVSVAGLETVYCYDNNYRRGQQLAMPWGVWSYTNNVATVTMQNPSACVGYGEINTDESNEGLLGLLALIALPVICLLGCYVWLFMRYTNTPAVVEAANPMQPVYLLQPAPMIAPSPAVQYMQMPAYIPQASYMAPPYMGY